MNPPVAYALGSPAQLESHALPIPLRILAPRRSPVAAFAADWKPAAVPAHDQVGQEGHAGERLAGVPAAAARPQGLAEPQRPVGLRHHREGRGASREKWDGQILVPFCVESALSGVGKHVTTDQNLWYSPHVRGARRVEGQARAAPLRGGGLGGDRLRQRQGSSARTAAATTRSPSTSPTR